VATNPLRRDSRTTKRLYRSSIRVRSRERTRTKKCNVDIVFEIELVKQVEVNTTTSSCSSPEPTSPTRGQERTREIRRHRLQPGDAQQEGLIESFIEQVNLSGRWRTIGGVCPVKRKEADLSALLRGGESETGGVLQIYYRRLRVGSRSGHARDIDWILHPVYRFSGAAAPKEADRREKLAAFSRNIGV
jgi:hypothetical protein